MNNDMKFTVMFHEFGLQSIQQLIGMYGAPRTVIEIGLFEGHTTFNMTDMLTTMVPNYKHYAIDPYGKSADLSDEDINSAEALFTHNLAVFEKRDHIEFINDTSLNGLLRLIHLGVKADLIYIDGDHRAETVLEDLVLSWQLLDTGGVILCDDSVSWKHRDAEGRYSLQQNPKLAVDNFIQCNWDRLEVLTLNNGYQTAFRKL